jgi:Spy/CpxP family protein refolding chaperone
MEKSKLITFSIIALLLINLATLGFLLLSGPKNGPTPPHGGRPKPKEIIVEKLNFDTKQQVDYDQLIQQHRKEITTTEDHIKSAKNELYLLLNDESVDVAKKDSLISLLSNYQKEIETIHFNHFRDIKKLCKPEQLNDFNDLTEELSRLFSKPHRPRNE